MMATKVEFNEDIVIVHNFCVWCKKEGNFILTAQQYHDIVVNGKFIQDVFPDLDAGEHEFMISGSHAVCWDKASNEEEEQ